MFIIARECVRNSRGVLEKRGVDNGSGVLVIANKHVHNSSRVVAKIVKCS